VANTITNQSLDKIKFQDIDVSDIGNKLILQQIKPLRSNFNLRESDTETNAIKMALPWHPMIESYCHTFYRILGLPVINKSKNGFYNPGFLGDEDTSEEVERRAAIDGDQDTDLLQWERTREQMCSDNLLLFDNAETKLDYRLEMMKSPIDVNMLDQKLSDPFAPDKEEIELNFKDREKFKKVGKILRPFKCTPYITENIEPSSNKICAPFVPADSAVIHNNKLTQTYLELVCRSRFAMDTNKYNDASDLFKTSLIDQMKKLNLLDKFQENISALSDVEAYIFLQLFSSFVSVCIKVKETRISNIKLANEIYAKIYLSGEEVSVNSSGTIEINSIDKQIAAKKQEKATRDFILAQIPTGGEYIDGIKLSNPINCALNHTFVSLLQNDVSSIDKDIEDLEQQKNNQLKLFNNINQTSFYVLGEVCGIGLIDIMVLMMSFWLLPQDQLLGLLDGPSFERLYRETSLHNTTVESRKSYSGYYYSNISISYSIGSMDKLVLNLLNTATDIVMSGTAT